MTVKTDTKLQQLYFWGRPLSPLYSCIMANRSSFYQNGVFKQHELDVPVISVGNLVMGGTGKTPLVIYIAEFLQQLGKKPAILSRGYKGTATAQINVVSNGSDILLGATQAGDEPRLLAEKLPGISVITGKKRYVTGRYAIDSCGADLLILDDGFQHMALKRTVDLVLFSSQKLLGNGRVLPGGDLREPLSALKRAHAFVISGVTVPLDSTVKEFIRLLNHLYPDKPVFTGSYLPGELINRVYEGQSDTLSISEACKIPVYGFCGIAEPDSFHKLLQKSGMNLVGFQPFADHHAYSANDIGLLNRKGVTAGARALITTEKDLVKIRDLFPENFPLFSLPLRFQLGSDFEQFLLEKLGNS